MPDNEIQLTPNFQFLFRQFLVDTRNAGENLARDLAYAHADGRQSPQEHLENRAKVLRVVQGFLAPVTIALQSATSVAEIEQLREVMATILTAIDQQAMQAELASEEER